MGVDSEYMSLEDVAKMLGVTYQLIYRLVRSGELPAVRLGKLLLPGVCYIVLVVSVAAMAASLLLQGQGTRALLLTLGGVCFAASDCVLSVQTFGPEKTVRRSVFVHAAYYTAQLLIAWSIAA